MSDYEEVDIKEIESEITILDEQESEDGNIVYDEQDNIVIEPAHKYVDLTNVVSENNTRPQSNVVKNIKIGNENRDRPKSRHSSELWNKFTILSRKNYVASCNICGAKLSFRSTTSNLKKHMIRKHPNDNIKYRSINFKPKVKHTSSGEEQYTDLNSLILNVVGNDNEESHVVAYEVGPSDVQNDVHEYCGVNEEEPPSKRFNSKVTYLPRTNVRSSYQPNYTPPTPRDLPVDERSEAVKRNRILALQLECLEIRKYVMQMESLSLERQLNLPRSIYTENLRHCDTMTKGTQTEVGGSDTKVFFVSDSQRAGTEGSQHFFSFRAHVQE